MKMKFGAIVTDGRGKIGGQVASKNRHGAYLRTKVTPSNGQTTFQQGVRNLFTSLSQGWRSLTQAQRDSWNNAVASFAKTDIFGDLRNPSGANLYQKLNNNLLSIGQLALTDAPLPVEVPNTSLLSISETAVTGVMNLVLSGAVAANSALKIFATAPMSPGKSFVKSEYRLIATLVDGDASPFEISSFYAIKFGSVPAIGQKVFFKAVPIAFESGQAGSASSAMLIKTL